MARGFRRQVTRSYATKNTDEIAGIRESLLICTEYSIYIQITALRDNMWFQICMNSILELSVPMNNSFALRMVIKNMRVYAVRRECERK